MLTTSMSEGMSGKVKLTHKDATEFNLFYGMLHVSTMRPITREIALVLSYWADEYQVEALKKQCEDFLTSCEDERHVQDFMHVLECLWPLGCGVLGMALLAVLCPRPG